MKASINVQHSEWIADGQVFPAGEQEVEVSKTFAPLLAGAVAAGAVALVDPTPELLSALDGHVEADEVSLAKLEAAMGNWVPPTYGEDGAAIPGYWDGVWTEGHLLSQQAERKIEVPVDVEVEA